MAVGQTPFLETEVEPMRELARSPRLACCVLDFIFKILKAKLLILEFIE
jgi:hypothetical protein